MKRAEVIGRPWRIVAVTFDDGTTVQVTEEALRRYLESGDEADLGLGTNRATAQLRTAIRRVSKTAAAAAAASRPRRTNVTRAEVLSFKADFEREHGTARGWKTAAARKLHTSIETINARLANR